MRHRRKLIKLGRNTKQRQALFKMQLRQLVLQGSLTTTEAKAKQIKRLMDKIVYRAKTNTVDSRRKLHKIFGNRNVVNTLVDQVAPLFDDRDSGFTSLQVVGKRRGDNSLLVKLAFIKQREHLGTLKKTLAKGKK